MILVAPYSPKTGWCDHLTKLLNIFDNINVHRNTVWKIISLEVKIWVLLPWNADYLSSCATQKDRFDIGDTLFRDTLLLETEVCCLTSTGIHIPEKKEHHTQQNTWWGLCWTLLMTDLFMTALNNKGGFFFVYASRHKVLFITNKHHSELQLVCTWGSGDTWHSPVINISSSPDDRWISVGQLSTSGWSYISHHWL